MNVFINRIYEKGFLKKDFNNHKGTSRVLIVNSESGIGKSSLIEKVLDECEVPKLRVKIARHSSNTNIEGLFIRQLASAINDYSEANNTEGLLTFVEFIKEKKVDVKKYLSAAVADITRLKKISEQLSKDIDYESKILNQTLFYSSDSVVYEATRYVEYALENKYYYILVDNSQIIDSYSLNCFYHFLVQFKTYLILEYTQSRDVNIELDALNGYFTHDKILINTYNLKKLPLIDIILAFQNSPKQYIDLVKESYEESSGNLHKLKMLSNVKINPKKELKYDEIDSFRILELDKKLKLLLCGIASHEGFVSEDLLFLFLRHRHLKSIIPLINELELIDEMVKEDDLILKDKGYKIKHDSLINFLLTDDNLERYRLISNDIWLSIYHSLYKGEHDLYMPKHECIAQILFFSSKVSSNNEFDNFLGKNIDLIPRLLSVERCIKSLESLRERLFNNNDYCLASFDKKLALIYYRTFNYKKAKVVSENYAEEPLMSLIYLTSLGLDGEIIKAEQVGLNIIANIDVAKLRIGAIIALISSYRANNMIDKARTLWEEHKKLETFAGTLFEPYFYKCADFLLYDTKDRKEKLQFLEQALEGFVKAKNQLQILSCHISLGRFYLRDQNYRKVQQELDKAKEIANDHFYKYSLVENNIAVYLIRKGEYSFNEVEDQLLGALNNTSSYRDRFIVLNNLLVLYGENKKKSLFEYILEEMETEIGRNILDYELQKIFFYNVFIFYNSVNDKSLAVFYHKKGNKIPSFVRPKTWDKRFANNTLEERPTTKQIFKTVNLVNWTFDFFHLFK